MTKRITQFELIIILTVYLIAFSNCKKEEHQSDILTSKTWKRGSVDLNPSTNPQGEHQYYPIFNCDIDDKYTFRKDGNLVIDRGTKKCDPNEIQTETLIYSIDRETNKLIIDSISYILAEESETQIKYYKPVPGGTSLTSCIIYLLQ
jgi:hypothetical protein